ncbi:DNA polymerase theta isoform X2 [Ceratina calcarata]|uniref:DNA polymerase theta n=1 Tax=Ceratina calcarata TaxID=156304 RepID=A0AAJ7J8T4_9HYME|nr:DNA polymerase theta isoform X2 [Ceratina calcarata]
MDIVNDDSDIDKYFKDSIFSSELLNKLNNIDNNESNGRTRPTASQHNSGYKKLKLTISKSKSTTTTNTSTNQSTGKTKLKTKSTSLRRKDKLSETNKENTNIPSSLNPIAEQFITSELSVLRTENNSNSNATTNDISRAKSANNSATINSTEKSLESHSSVSIIPTQDRCKLSSWGLPTNILKRYEARGVTTMFAWQVECLSNHKVIEERRNLVYSAPTSAGKTLVAEILMMKTVLEKRKKVIFILPFVSVVREKMYYFQDLLSDSGVRAEGFMGGIVPPGGFAATQVAIATIEKANSLINRLMEENELSNLGAVVIDELHLVGDPSRGYLLELLLTKLKFITIKDENVNIQLIGMSATLPNLSLLAKWLDAELYKTDFRPVPLNEQCKIEKNIYDNKLCYIRQLTPMPELSMDTDDIIHLCIETISDGHSVLIFCPTKNWCEKLAQQISAAFSVLGLKDTQLGRMLRQELNPELISETLEQLKRCPTGLDSVLRNTVSFGTAFHHAGLTMDERDVIEGAFRTGSLRILVATSTLSSGVNLPARRVIIRSPMFGGRLLDSLTYKQMIGRAGRMGRDTAGESILVCKPNEQKGAEALLSASLEPIESCLNDSGPLIRALLEAIASEAVYTPADLELYTKCTLVHLSNENDSKNPSTEAVKFLIDNEFLLLQKTEEGQRDGLMLLEALQKARRCFVLDTELHVVYLVTPLNSGSQIGTIDWMTFFDLWRKLPESERRVGQLVGVEERFLMSAIRGVVRSGKSLNIHKRFYTALALHDLVREVPLNTVCKKYSCCRGVLQSLQQSASTFAGMVTQFCKQLGWDCMELLVSQFQTRLQFGVCRELLDLLRLPMLNGLRARSLYKHGITSVADLAIANELDVERALYKALPFESEKEQDGEHELEALKRNKMRTVFVTGKDGLTPHEAAVSLVQEARMLVQNELGLQNVPWKENEQSVITNESNTEINSRIHQSTNRTIDNCNIQMQIEIADNNCQSKICSDENDIKNKHVKSVIEDDQSIDKDWNLPDKKNTELNHKDETPDMIDSVTKNVKKPNSQGVICTNKEMNASSKSHKVEKSTISPIVADNSEKDKPNLPNEFQNTVNNTGLTNQLLQIEIPECTNSSEEKLSFDFFEGSSPKLRHDSQQKRDSASLIDLTSKNNCIHNFTMRKLRNNIQNDQDTNSIPNKKVRISNEANTAGSPGANKTTHLSMIPATSQSPSLFDESLNLDTQICDILEQNIIDSLQFSEFEDSRSLQKAIVNREVNNKSQTNEPINRDMQPEENTRDLNKNTLDATNSLAKSNILSWKDDSWNEPKKLAEKINRLKDKNNQNILAGPSIRNIKNKQNIIESAGTSDSTPEIKKKLDSASELPTGTPDNIRKISQIHRLKDTAAAKSPLANVVLFNKNRTASLDSNKSDSDDIVVASQNMNSPLTNVRLRSRLDSEKKQKFLTQKIPDQLPVDNKKHQNTVSKTIQIEKRKIEPTLKDIIAHNTLIDKNCSTDSVISNSEEDTPVKSTKILQKSRMILKSTQKAYKQYVQENEIMDTVDELTDWNTLNIIKVGSDRGTFNLFKREVIQKRYIALALNCQLHNDEANAIGTKIISSTSEKKKRSKKPENYTHINKKLCGAAITWSSNIAYYISFTNEQDLKVPGKEQMKLLKELLSNTFLNVKCFATKDIFKTLHECCGITPSCKFLDPKVANWLYDGNIQDKTFSEIITEYFPQGCFISKKIGVCYDVGPGLQIKSAIPGEFRASAESVLTWHVTDSLLDKLEELNSTLLYTFKEIEMKTVTLLACMELNGLGVCLQALQDLSSVIRKEMLSLEERGYKLAGRKFNFASSKQVGQALGLYKGKKLSVNKAVLEHTDHPLSTIVMSWRKLSATQSKIVYPVLSIAQRSSRIHGNCVTCTTTGRISMHEPNLQNVPRDFNSEDDSFTISARMAFIPSLGNIMLSADYCQLELRILAHFSKDPILCDIMRSPGDIFKSIAASWNHVSECQVDDKMRQQTKQLCYGMIYGMGVKTLSENLSVDEEKGKEFLDSFMNAYPNINRWLNNVREEARTNGYITTLLERRRMFPGLASTDPSEKAQAERQAVNTKVQGSAADIAKKAMVIIEERMRYEFPTSAIVMPTVNPSTRRLRSNSREGQQRGGYLVLQLHDEFLYEVNINDLRQVATIVKESMEQVCQLTVPLPVKLKVGPAWGDLSQYTIC